ncbi:hypothetical protein M7I_8074 [Glarea lozoyensis 74030]|uniref:Uncharacterized protein n=1 Tax=Glarea lozoyensis (strain ATCC 74030 / MF5533) TaxID=1104152 RepID=H0EZ12_GLAL7|nr:hypothetical protein M7I_8074 [Glarea lozoyensis 74030]
MGRSARSGLESPSSVYVLFSLELDHQVLPVRPLLPSESVTDISSACISLTPPIHVLSYPA